MGSGLHQGVDSPDTIFRAALRFSQFTIFHIKDFSRLFSLITTVVLAGQSRFRDWGLQTYRKALRCGDGILLRLYSLVRSVYWTVHQSRSSSGVRFGSG